MKTLEYVSELKKSIDSQLYTSVVLSLGNQLNDRKDRFDKADIIEQTVSESSNNRLKWVDDIGRDHYDVETGLDLEFKYMTNGLFTKTGKEKAVVKVKLKNSLGKNKGVEIENPADFYLLGQQDSIAIISGADVKQYLVAVPDGIEAHIPFKSLEFIFKPEEVSSNILVKVSYKEQKQKMQQEMIKEAKKQLKKMLDNQ